MELRIRPAVGTDAARIAAIWEPGWRDGHLGHVPDALVAVRSSADFAWRASGAIPHALVGEFADEVVGFVVVVDDEVEQVYLDPVRRGTGDAAELLRAAESRVAEQGFSSAWLAVVAGNERARRFYERNGWVDDGELSYVTAFEHGTVEVPCRRYVKDVVAH